MPPSNKANKQKSKSKQKILFCLFERLGKKNCVAAGGPLAGTHTNTQIYKMFADPDDIISYKDAPPHVKKMWAMMEKMWAKLDKENNKNLNFFFCTHTQFPLYAAANSVDSMMEGLEHMRKFAVSHPLPNPNTPVPTIILYSRI